MSRAAEKRAIAQRFSQAAHTYDSVATLQREAAALLALRLPDETVAGLWLDAGCGTGHAAPLLASRAGQLIALDLAPGMLGALPAATPRLCGDIEHLPLAAGCVGLYWSNLAWQWCAPAAAAREAARVLAFSGALRVATLGPGTLAELRSAFAGIDTARHVREFDSPNALTHALAHAGFTDIRLTAQALTAWLPDTHAVLRSLKQLGASEVGPGRRTGLMGKQTWARVQSRYEALRSEAGLPVTYEVLIIEARKP